jgi:hypothetical protein
MVDSLNTLLTRVSAALVGEPLRVVIYGALAIVWLVTNIALAVGYRGFGTFDLNAALAAVTAATVALNETVRQLVTSMAAPHLPLGTVVTTPNGAPAVVRLTAK